MMKEVKKQSEGKGRWGNGAVADNPVREARIKALMLKEQATRENITKQPIVSSPVKTNSGGLLSSKMDKRSPFMSIQSPTRSVSSDGGARAA
jgi:hypothetical protein